MLSRRLLLATATALLALGAVPGTALADPDVDTGCGRLGCGVGVQTGGTSAGTSDGGENSPVSGGGSSSGTQGSEGSGGAVGSGSSGGNSPPAPERCVWKTYDPPPAANSPLWGGRDPKSGSLQWNSCINESENGTVAVQNGLAQGATRFVANGETPDNAAPPPPPDPAVLAQQAYQQVDIPRPALNFGPNEDQVAVRYWLYLWTDDPGPLTATVSLGGVSVTGTARLQSVTWSMGSPSANGQGDAVTCNGPGKPAPANADVVEDPRPNGYCAFMYQLRSTPERTGGSGTWPVTASATWTFDWVASNGQTGQIVAPPFVSATGLCVGAWSTVNVADGYTPPDGACQA